MERCTLIGEDETKLKEHVESIRHSITKISHFHLVSNEEAKRRVMQLGKKKVESLCLNLLV